jgi:hypothetical protein
MENLIPLCAITIIGTLLIWHVIEYNPKILFVSKKVKEVIKEINFIEDRIGYYASFTDIEPKARKYVLNNARAISKCIKKGGSPKSIAFLITHVISANTWSNKQNQSFTQQILSPTSGYATISMKTKEVLRELNVISSLDYNIKPTDVTYYLEYIKPIR